MHHWAKRLFVAAAPLLLGSCLWGPGKFASELTLRKDGSFVLDYKGEMVLQTPPSEGDPGKWDPAMAHCTRDGGAQIGIPVVPPGSDQPQSRPCTAAEIARLKKEHEASIAASGQAKRKQNDDMAKAFGLPGFDDASIRTFAAKLMKYEGWRSVVYRGDGVFQVDYHLEGRATQDVVFPLLPDNDIIIPFVAMRRRTDGSVLVSAPGFTGGGGPLAARAGPAALGAGKGGPQSRAEGRFTITTDGAILTNNSEDGPARAPAGSRLTWDITPASGRIPEALIGLR